MVYILAILLIGIMLLSYESTGKDWLTPSTLITLMFLLSTIAAIYNLGRWKFELGAYSVFLIIFSLIITLIINAAFHSYYGKKRVSFEKHNISEIKFHVLIVGTFYTIVCLVLQFRIISSIGIADISAAMYSYRMSTAYGIGNINITENYSQLFNIATAITYVVVFNLIYFFKKLKRTYIVVSILQITAWIFLYFLNGSRSEVFSMFVYSFVIFYMNRIRTLGRYKKYNYRQILKILFIVIGALYSFYFFKELAGRQSDKTVIEYLTSYLGGSIPCFDLFIKKPLGESVIFGQETFLSVIQGLQRRGMLKNFQYSFFQEFRSSNGIGLGNVYTALRDYYFDFGFIGMIIMHTVFSLLFSWIYEKGKVRGSNIGLIILAMTYNCIVLYAYNNQFFSMDISIGFLLKLIYTIIMYKLFIRKKVLNFSLRGLSVRWSKYNHSDI